jgi:hypothetical protein
MQYVGVSVWSPAVSQRIAAMLEQCEIPWLALTHGVRAALELDVDDDRIALLVAALLTAHGIAAAAIKSPDEFLEWERTYYIGLPGMTREQGEGFVQVMREGSIAATSTVVDDILVLTVTDHVVATEFVRSFPSEEQRTIIMAHDETGFWNRVRAFKTYGN